MNDAASLLRAGDLHALRTLLADRVRKEPGKPAHRIAYADILIVQGDLERADNQLALAADQDETLGLQVALGRQLIRAATARDETFNARRPPELIADPDAAITAALSRLAGVNREEATPDLKGTIDGRPFVGFRDGDDRTAEVLEVLTSTGKYVWISLAQIASLSLAAPERPRDLVWRKTELEVRGGPSGVVYLPAIYPNPESDAQRLGHETDWTDEGAGIGLRTFLIGEDAVALGEFSELTVFA